MISFSSFFQQNTHTLQTSHHEMQAKEGCKIKQQRDEDTSWDTNTARDYVSTLQNSSGGKSRDAPPLAHATAEEQDFVPGLHHQHVIKGVPTFPGGVVQLSVFLKFLRA